MRYIGYVKKILKGHLTHKNIPILVTICLTNRCNLRCLYCYEDYYERDHREFSTKELLNLIDELSQMGTRYISLNGGEVLLRDDLGVIIDRIKRRNMLCHLSTNGLLVKNHISVLKEVDSIAISIDGIKESNDLNRGDGTYERIIESFECLKKNNIKFHTHTVLTKNNKNCVDEMMELSRKYGFKAQFSTLRIEGSPEEKIRLSDDELKESVRKIIDYKNSGENIFFSKEAYRNVLSWPFSYDKEMIFDKAPNGYECYIKRFSCHIEANGLVYPCVVLVNKFKALNFLEVGFKKAWENLANNVCKACYNVCCSELSFIFGLKFRSIWNTGKIVLDRISRSR